MITLLLLVIVVIVVWTFIAPGGQFLRGFARLLTEPTIQRGPMSFFSGRSYAIGRFQDRKVAIRLQLKRGSYRGMVWGIRSAQQGYLVVAVQTGGQPALNYDGIDARTRDDAGRRAMLSIAAHDLLLSVEEGWLKALWQPQGFARFARFPGRFLEDKWRQVLDAMQTIATSLEAAA